MNRVGLGLVLSSLLLFPLLSCKKTDSEGQAAKGTASAPAKGQSQPFLGKWKPAKGGEVVEFFADGTMNDLTRSGSEVGSYTVVDDKHLKLGKGDHQAVVVEFKVTGDTMTLKAPGSTEDVFTRATDADVPVPQRVVDAQITATRSDIANIGTALDAFKIDTGHYPTTADGLQALAGQPAGVRNWNGPYVVRQLKTDPWNHPYLYRCPGSHNVNGYDLWSMGPDGRDGTGDDIGNWSER